MISFYMIKSTVQSLYEDKEDNIISKNKFIFLLKACLKVFSVYPLPVVIIANIILSKYSPYPSSTISFLKISLMFSALFPKTPHPKSPKTIVLISFDKQTSKIRLHRFVMTLITFIVTTTFLQIKTINSRR